MLMNCFIPFDVIGLYDGIPANLSARQEKMRSVSDWFQEIFHYRTYWQMLQNVSKDKQSLSFLVGFPLTGIGVMPTFPRSKTKTGYIQPSPGCLCMCIGHL